MAGSAPRRASHTGCGLRTRAWLALGAASLFIAGVGGMAHATTITQNLDTGLMVTDLDNVPLTLNLFDSNLGTLTGVSFTVSGRMTANGAVTNTAAQAQNFMVTEDILYALTDNGGPLASLLPSASPDPSESQKYTSAQTNMANPFGPYDITTSATTITGPLADFEQSGGGTDVIDVSTTTGTTVHGGGGNVGTNIATEGEGKINVLYTYTPATVTTVPEPAGLTVIGFGMLGLVLARRRRPVV